ncbi:mitochondrial 18 KDa protein-domain-containing protein [Cunninghamella echinulata]|nr:mitochondrial 18 KDa protein-domain-containing protein [Cunninghamella echinulata]
MSSTTQTETIPPSADESIVERIEEGEIDTTDTVARYLGYGARLRTLAKAGSRYLAYSSDVGESFRPLLNPKLVTATYMISWTYVLGDVAYEGYKAYDVEKKPSDEVAIVVVKRALFQSIASMILPMTTIHTAVKYSSKAMKNVKNPFIRTTGPTAIGLAIIPFLPTLFDEVVKENLDKVFERWEKKADVIQEDKKVI